MADGVDGENDFNGQDTNPLRVSAQTRKTSNRRLSSSLATFRPFRGCVWRQQTCCRLQTVFFVSLLCIPISCGAFEMTSLQFSRVQRFSKFPIPHAVVRNQ